MITFVENVFVYAINWNTNVFAPNLKKHFSQINKFSLNTAQEQV